MNSEPKRWKTSDSITIGIWVTVLVTLGILFTLILTNMIPGSVSDIKPISLIKVEEPTVESQKEIKKVFNGDSLNPNHKITCDGYLSNHTPQTNNFLHLDYFPTYNSESTLIPTSIVCFVYEKKSGSEVLKKSNFFPVFIFDGVVNELTKHESADYDIVVNSNNENSLSLTNAGRQRQYLKAQENANKVTAYLLNKTFFGSELSLLDAVYFRNNIVVNGVEASGVYSNKMNSVHSLERETKNNIDSLINNKRTISLRIEKTEFNLSSLNDKYTGIKEELLIPIDSTITEVTATTPTQKITRKLVPGTFYQKPNYEGISFNLNHLGQTFAHEYGHHYALFANLKDENDGGKELLNKIMSTFPFISNQQRIDFYNLYNYFNSPPTSSSDKSVIFQTGSDQLTKITIYDEQYLRTLRKYTSKNIISLQDIFSDIFMPTVENSGYLRHHKYLILKSIVDNKFVNKDLKDRLRSTFVQEYSTVSGELVWFIDVKKYNDIKDNLDDFVIKNQYFYKEDIGSIITSVKENNNTFVNMYPVSNSFIRGVSNSEDAVTISDIFPDLKPTGSELFTNGEFTCTDAPYDPIAGSYLNMEAVLLNNALSKETGEITSDVLEKVSNKVDVEYLELMKYHFSYSELLARLFSILTHTQEDYEVALDGCAINIDTDPNTNETTYSRKDVPSSELLEDYGFFKMFDMNIYESEQTTRTLANLVIDNNKVTDFNKIRFQTTKYSTGVVRDSEQESMLFYSHNMHGVDFPNTETSIQDKDTEIKGSNTIYMLAHVKLRDSRDVKNITLEFTNSNGQTIRRKAYDYDFNHRIVTIPSSSKTFDNMLNQRYLDEYGNELKGYHFEVSFKIETIHVRVSQNGREGFIFNNEYKSRSEIESTFSNMTKVFVDKNENGVYDSGDILLST